LLLLLLQELFQLRVAYNTHLQNTTSPIMALAASLLEQAFCYISNYLLAQQGNVPATAACAKMQFYHHHKMTRNCNSMEKILLAKLTVTQLIKKLHAFYGTKRSTAMFTKVYC
jgi:hypothetical protein